MEDNRDLKLQAFHHLEQARIHLQQTRELLEEAQSKPGVAASDWDNDTEPWPYLP